MSETRRGTTACLFSYGQLESKDETEEVTLSAHLLEKPCIDFVGCDVSVSIGLSSVIGSSESARKGRRSRSVGMAWHVTPPPFNWLDSRIHTLIARRVHSHHQFRAQNSSSLPSMLVMDHIMVFYTWLYSGGSVLSFVYIHMDTTVAGEVSQNAGQYNQQSQREGGVQSAQREGKVSCNYLHKPDSRVGLKRVFFLSLLMIRGMFCCVCRWVTVLSSMRRSHWPSSTPFWLTQTLPARWGCIY